MVAGTCLGQQLASMEMDLEIECRGVRPELIVSGFAQSSLQAGIWGRRLTLCSLMAVVVWEGGQRY